MKRIWHENSYIHVPLIRMEPDHVIVGIIDCCEPDQMQMTSARNLANVYLVYYRTVIVYPRLILRNRTLHYF